MNNISHDNFHYYGVVFKGYFAYFILWGVTIVFIKELTFISIICFFIYLFLALRGVYRFVKSPSDYSEESKRYSNQAFNEILFNLIGCIIVGIGYYIIILSLR